jgi:hypothetical protein
MLNHVNPKTVALIKYLIGMVLLVLICGYFIYKSYVRQFDSGFYLFGFAAVANYVYVDKSYKNYKEFN